jgi:tetratricopeptide (TPR) repeat protein
MSKIGSSTKIQRLLKESSSLCHSGKFNEAKEIYQALLELIPNHPEVLGNLGTIELQGGNTDLGISYLTRALKSNPKEIKFIINLANAYISINKFTEALEQLDSAEKISPNLLNIFYNKARALRGLKEFDTAIIYLNKCLAIDPNNYLVLCDLALLFTEKENFNAAIDLYSKAIKINPENYLTYYNRGSAYEKLNEFQNALADYNNVIQKNTFFEPALFNKFRILFKQGIYHEALDQINYLLKLDSKNMNYFLARATIFEESKEYDLAIQDYDHIINNIEDCPEARDARAKKGFIKLTHNQFREGWELYEYRWGIRDNKILIPGLKDFNVIDKNIIIWSEQGIGDQILFSSLLFDALSTANNFTISIDPRLIQLFSRSFSWAKNINFISKDEIITEAQYDYHLPIGSLGKFFRNSDKDFDKHPIAYLKSDESRTNFLKEKINKKNHAICGVSWKSSNLELGAEKSLTLRQLNSILSSPNKLFLNLQYGETRKEIEKNFKEFNVEIQSIEEIDNFNDIDGLASLISACDYIVTTSNVTAHIAGALNKKTYLILPYSIGKIWYWGESSDDSLWYPSIEIFRKTRTDSWANAIEKLSNKLKLNYD